jgi:hypothetical protein
MLEQAIACLQIKLNLTNLKTLILTPLVPQKPLSFVLNCIKTSVKLCRD